MPSVCIINRYYPPDPSITGESACELAHHLDTSADEVRLNVVHVSANYCTGQPEMNPVGDIRKIATIYSGKNKLLRLATSMLEGYRLSKIAVTTSDMVISMTDPPLVNIWTGYLCNRLNKPWAYWSMDLYPYAFHAAGIVRQDNLFYTFLDQRFRKYSPSLLLALGEQQADYVRKKWNRDVPHAILPCGIFDPKRLPPVKRLPVWKCTEKIVFSYAGNLGEAHDPAFILDFIDCMDPAQHTLVLSLYGSKASSVLEKVGNNPSVRIVPSVAKGELQFIDVHLVSLFDEWTNICVPSKAVSAICAGQTILFNGSASSDTWQMLGSAGWLVQSSNSELRKREIAVVLRQIDTKETLALKKITATSLCKSLLQLGADAMSAVTAWVKNS
jgi:hypothetical protein